MRKIELGSIRMSKPLGAVAPLFKPSVPLFHGGCTVLSIQPSTSILSEKALAALKYAFLQNKKVGIAGVRVDSLKPPCDSDLEKTEAAYSIARELVEWSEQFIVDDESHLQASLETQDDRRMNDKGSRYGIDSKDDDLKTKMFGDVKDPEIKDPEIKAEIKDPEIKLENFDEFKVSESGSKLAFFDFMSVKTESACRTDSVGSSERRHPTSASAAVGGLTNSKGAETFDFLKDTGCDGFDYWKSDDTEFGGPFLSISSIDPSDSLDLPQHSVDIDLAFPVPPLPMFSKMDSDHEIASPITSPQSPFLFSPISISPNSPSPSFPDS